MRKGFSATLVAVVFAMSLQAMALAPTISEIPDIIVGNAEGATAANIFVFPDVLNLNSYVTDDETPASGVVWSYHVQAGTYRINNANPIDPATGDLVNPPQGNRIDVTNLDPLDVDQNPRTITVRDELRSPVAVGGGSGPYPSPGSAGILDSGKVVTLFASDGTTVSLEGRSFIVYSDNGGLDRFSAEGIPTAPPIVDIPDFGIPGHGWTQSLSTNTGSGASMSNPASGLCVTIAAGANKQTDAQWRTGYGYVELVANRVWQARLSVTTTQTTAFTTPLWSFLYDNFSTTGAGQNEYNGEFLFLDNEGGANSPIAGLGRNNFEVWMMPIQMQTPQFLDTTYGFFQPGVAAAKDMRLIFRVLDVAPGGINADIDNGTVCMKSLKVYAHDLASMTVEDTLYNQSNLTGTAGQPGSIRVEDITNNSTVTFSGGNMIAGQRTATGATSWNGPTLLMMTPGDNVYDYTNPSTIADNFPIAWVADQLYYIEVEMSTATIADESNPPDVIRVGADTPTAELTTVHLLVPNVPDVGIQATDFSRRSRGVSAPRMGTPQKYGAFFYSHSAPLAGPTAAAPRWRPRVEILNDSILDPNGPRGNTGRVTFHSIKVSRVSF